VRWMGMGTFPCTIGWSAGDFAPTPSHTTGRAVFRIRLSRSVVAYRDCKAKRRAFARLKYPSLSK